MAGAVGVAMNVWYAGRALHGERARVRSALLPFSNTVAAAVGRHVSRMSALAAYVNTRADNAQLQREFALFADGLMASVPGIRAVQIIRDGRITMVHPEAENAAVLGLSLRDNSDPATRAGYRRAVASEGVTIFGPARLAQGGEALVIDQRLKAKYDPTLDFVAMLVDMSAIVKDLESAKLPAGLAFEVLDAEGRSVGRFGGTLPGDPVAYAVEVRDGAWTVQGGPAAGWDAALAGQLLPVRLATAAIVLLLTVIAALVAGRDARLSRAVDLRTASLRELAEDRHRTIQELRATETALAASEERLRLALAASRAATFEVEVATGRMNWSPEVAPMFGLALKDVPTELFALMHFAAADDAERVRAAYADACRHPAQGTLEVRTEGADGVARWLALYWLSREEDGAIRRVVGSLTDVSERKRLEEQFLHAQKMQAMGSLAGGIAHDFNNLLTVIMGAGQMARMGVEQLPAAEGVREDLDEVLGASERAAVMTGQLLAFSRRQVVQPRHFDACDLIGGMGTMLRRLVGEHIRVETALPGTKVPIFADHGQLTQVVMNLAVNARDAMPVGGTLRIHLRTGTAPSGASLPGETLSDGPYAVLSVTDTGSGIDPAVLPSIFDPFFTTKPVGQGTGLGLSTVYGIVVQLAGTVRVTSELGKGTTFNVYLPLSDHVEEAAPVAPVSTLVRDGVGRTVLLAEDEHGLRSVVDRVLAGAGYRVLSAEDGAAALAVARAHEGRIDLLITDIVMPRLGGLELASQLLAERPETRLLFMSGYPRQVGQETAVSLADAHFVPKPFKPSDLLNAVRRTLAGA